LKLCESFFSFFGRVTSKVWKKKKVLFSEASKTTNGDGDPSIWCNSCKENAAREINERKWIKVL